jgi:hypothetical protein
MKDEGIDGTYETSVAAILHRRIGPFQTLKKFNGELPRLQNSQTVETFERAQSERRTARLAIRVIKPPAGDS